MRCGLACTGTPRMGKLTAGPIWDFDRARPDGTDATLIGERGTAGGTDPFTHPLVKEMLADQTSGKRIDRYTQLLGKDHFRRRR